MPGLFTPAERLALAPPERLTPSQWADRYRYLPSNVTAEPGRYRSSRTPYLVGIIDSILEPIEEIVVKKAAQVGYTTGLQNLIGWSIDQDAAPVLLVMPSQDEARKLVDEQIIPLIDSCPQLQTHLLRSDPNAITKEVLKFDTMPLYLGWSGSAATLGRRSVKTVLMDEVDKFNPFSGRDAAPIPLARKRVTNYRHRGRVLIGSTPTTADGEVSKAFAGCPDKRAFQCPCVHCGIFQTLTFPQIKFTTPDIADPAVRADYIALHPEATHYECVGCRGRITDAHKPALLARGVWASEGQVIDRHGNADRPRPAAKRVGFHLSALLSPWVSFAQVASAFIRAQDDYGALMEWRNQTMGETHEAVVTTFKADDLRQQRPTAPDAGIVPRWAGKVIATADVHLNRYNFVVRAHGRGDRSQLLTAGTCDTLEDLTRICLNTPFQVQGSTQTMLPAIMFVDAGYRTDEIYAYSQTDGRIKPCLGARSYNPDRLLHWAMASKELGVNVVTIDTQYYKTKLATLRSSGKWKITKVVDDDYLTQMAGEHKVVDRKSGREVWVKISSGAQNHFMDCETYNLAAADHLQTNLLPDEPTMEAELMKSERQHEQDKQQPVPRSYPMPPPSNSWLGNTSKWF